MGIINILDDNVSNIIAAGEVVENPASMIKELIENSIDAKAKNISLQISSNLDYFKIIDDGIGMDRSDLLMCIERHATSKIKTKEDVFNLLTYGFRGEALASIAAVSKISISSRYIDSKIGYKMISYAGVIREISETSINQGTEIEVRDLFYNTPARKKFLRKTTTELNKLKDIVLKEALGAYNVAFELIIDDKKVLKTTGTSLDKTIFEIFGKTNYTNLNKFELGFLGNVESLKSSKDYMYIYVNNRYVKSNVVDRAIINGYETKLMKGKYPFVILFLEINPNEIDINVDPSKKFIKFSNEQIIYKDIVEKIKDFFYIKDREMWKPKIEINKVEENIENSYYENLVFEKKEESLNDISETLQNESIYVNNTIIESSKKNEQFLGNKPFEEKQIGLFERSDGTNRVYDVLGQVFDTYILVNNKEEDVIEIYDQHIIHEGILYEELLTKLEENKLRKKQLLIPQIITLLPDEKNLIFSNIKIFNEFGFEIDEISETQIALRSVPDFPFRKPMEQIFKSVIENILKNEYKIIDIREEIIISMSCRGAIKAGDKLNMVEMQNMVRRLNEVKRYTCPHGRPIVAKILRDELDKKFGRKK